MFSREVIEGIQDIGKNEKVRFRLTVPTSWGSNPSNVVLTLYDTTNGEPWTDVTSTKLSGSSSVAGNVITLVLIVSLTKDHTYRLDVNFECEGNTLEGFIEILCTR